MNRCVATIASPWRMGMHVTCCLTEGHSGLHQMTFTDGAEVRWTGQHDRFTEREAAQRADIEENFRKSAERREARLAAIRARKAAK